MKIRRCGYICVSVDERETEAVKTAVGNMIRDLRRTLWCRTNQAPGVERAVIHVGTAGIEESFDREVDFTYLKDEAGKFRKEAYLIQEKSGELWIAGSDRRGTVYGIYEFCEKWLCVSPWYFFADVPVKVKNEVEIKEGLRCADYPSVEYRGVFINDEEALNQWAQCYMGEETIGVRTYEKIFELLLRLKMNYIWPAMHVNSFNMQKESGALADSMGIVVGTSHCDMLMRSNNREWKPWLKEKGLNGIEYDYSSPGRNREALKQYWRESIEQNRDFEVSYTLGMRGIHDSGFGTQAFSDKSGEELLKAKINLLETIIKDQEQMLSEVVGHKVQKNFVPYKEVLEFYDNGLKLPEDLTLIWVNDNYGYVRRYPDEKEKLRPGGNGIYYHNSYWAPPEGSYLFVDTIPLSHTRNELKKAYAEGIRKLWVTNFGSLKPREMQISFYAGLAWEAGRSDAKTDNEEKWLSCWLNRTFSGDFGERLAPALLRFDQVINTRKLEQMDMDAFSQNADGDEAAVRIHICEEILELADSIYEKLPGEEKDAFFELVLMKIHAAYYTNAMFYYADRSNLCMKQGKGGAAGKYAELSQKHQMARRKMLYYYNHVMANGKWNRILTPEDFPPARAAMNPACMPPLKLDAAKPVVTVWGDKKKLDFGSRDMVKWIEIANAGQGQVFWGLEKPEWIRMPDSTGNGCTDSEVRILFTPDKVEQNMEYSGEIRLCLWTGDPDKTEEIQIPVSCRIEDHGVDTAVEEDGCICVEAGDFLPGSDSKGWNRIENLGRFSGALMEACKAEENGWKAAEGYLDYRIFLMSPGRHRLELHRFPTLNSVGRIRFGITCDGGKEQILETDATDEYRGNWKRNVRDGVDRVSIFLPELSAGNHMIRIRAIDPYAAFTRFVIYTEELPFFNLGCRDRRQGLPNEWNPLAMADRYYGEIKTELRPEMYLAPTFAPEEPLEKEDIVIYPEVAARQVTPEEILQKGASPFVETQGGIRIDAAAALAGTAYANAAYDGWCYCNSDSYAGSGLAMYIRQEGHSFAKNEAPSLNYRIRTVGGTYRIWIKLLMWGDQTAHFTLGIDGNAVDEEKIGGGCPIWRFSSELVWKWMPALDITIEPGEHTLSIYALASRLRFDRIWMTRGNELPPVDAEWLLNFSCGI